MKSLRKDSLRMKKQKTHMSEIKGFHYVLKNFSVQFIGYILSNHPPNAKTVGIPTV